MLANKLLSDVRKNSASITALGMRIVSVILLFLLTLVLARTLGPERYGLYAFLFTLMQLSTTIGRGGLMPLLVRDIAVNLGAENFPAVRRMLWIGWVVALSMASTMAVVFASVLVPVLTGNTEAPRGVGLLGAAFIAAMILVGMLEAAIRGFGRVLIGQTAELLLRPVTQLTLIVLAILGLVGSAFDVKFAVGAAMSSAFCALAFALFNYFRTTKAIPKVACAPATPDALRSLLKMSGTAWVTAINGSLSLIMLGILGDEATVGVFSIAVQLTTLMTLGLVAANASMAPAMSRLSASSDAADLPRLQTLASHSCELSLVFGLPLALIYLFFGTALIPFTFGAPFSGAYWPTVILALGQLLNIGFGSVAILLYANRQEGVVFAATIVATIVNFVIGVVLIPTYGAIGAAIANSVSMATWNLISFVWLLTVKGIACFPLADKLWAKR